MNIKSQFNKLRISNNESWPCFFYYKNKKYILKKYLKQQMHKLLKKTFHNCRNISKS